MRSDGGSTRFDPIKGSADFARCRATCENVPRVPASPTLVSAAIFKLRIHSFNLASAASRLKG